MIPDKRAIVIDRIFIADCPIARLPDSYETLMKTECGNESGTLVVQDKVSRALISLPRSGQVPMRMAALPIALAFVVLTSPLLEAQITPPARLPAAAGPGRISGSAQTMEGQALQSVAITVRSAADSAIVTGVLTGNDGRFLVEGLPVGRYTIRVSSLGYKPRSSEVIELTAQAASKDLGVIKLDVLPVELKAVEAVGEKAAVVVEPDRTVYNTKSMPAAAGTAIDVLRAVPELEVDVNDNVKLRGNQAIAVHMNGRPAPLRGEQLANFLKQLPGNRIARVEVMPNPSAKHDPEGMGGIVNIVLKDDLDLGVSGSLSANASTRNRQYFNGRLNYQKGRLTLFSGAGVNTYSDVSTNWDLRTNLIAVPQTTIEQNSVTDYNSMGGNVDWTAELKVGKQAHFWSNSWIYWSKNASSGLLNYGIFNEAMAVRNSYDRDSDSDFFYGNADVGLGFKQIFQQQKHELTIDGRFAKGDNDTESMLTKVFRMVDGDTIGAVQLPIELTRNDVDSGTGNLYLQADYFRPLGPGRIDLGYRAYKRDNDYDNQLNIFPNEAAIEPRESTRSGYEYDEVFHSLYTTIGRTLGKFGVNLGLRAELSSTQFVSLVTDTTIDRSYNTLFPSLNLSYTPKVGRTVRFLYSKRISRPSPSYLNAFVPSTDPLNRFLGNVNLKPSYTHSFSLDFSYTGSIGTVRVAPYYRQTVDQWERIRTVDTLGVATSRWENAASGENYGSNFSLSLRSQGRLSGSTSFSLYRDVRDGTNIASTLKRDALMWSLSGNLGVKATNTLTGQVFANYFPVQSILQGRASGYAYTSLGLRQQLWGTRGSVSLNVNDPFNLYKFNSNTSDPTYTQRSRSSYVSRVATLGFTYNFGKPPQQQSRRTGEEGTGETIRVR
jgi:outer membrane beta-barrel protein/carboxypeptidase family protein